VRYQLLQTAHLKECANLHLRVLVLNISLSQHLKTESSELEGIDHEKATYYFTFVHVLMDVHLEKVLELREIR